MKHVKIAAKTPAIREVELWDNDTPHLVIKDVDHGLEKRRIGAELSEAGARTLRDELDKYIGDKPKPVTVDWIAAELRLDTARFKLELEKANAARLLKSTLDGLAKPVLPNISKGDKVIVAGKAATVFSVAFGIGGGHLAYDFDKPPVPVVKVGDVINGDTLRAVQWKRGTIFKTAFGNRFVLRADGKWVSLESNRAHAFSEFQAIADGDPVYTVEHAPGK